MDAVLGKDDVASKAGAAAFADMRSWLEHLGATGRLAVAHRGRRLRFETAAIASRLAGQKATAFPQPDGHPGTVVSGLVANRAWVAEALGIAETNLAEHFQDAAQRPIAWREAEGAECRQEVHRSPDLERLLPIPTHNEFDNGAYITAGLAIVRNPKTGRQNVSIHRLQVSGPRRLGAFLLPRHTLHFQRMAEEAGADLDVAIVIGVGPAVLLASQAIVPVDQDELEIAGALLGAPLPVVKCINSEIRVPAGAEIVIEGRFLANVREMEGPFGEYPQYYGDRAERHVIDVDLVTCRRDPLFHTIIGGGLEHLLLGAIPREGVMLSALRRSFPGVLDVHLPRGGACRFHLYIRFKKRVEGEAKNLILAAMAFHPDIKHVTVVDEDVDIHDPTQVEWAVATRFQGDRDLVIVPASQGSKLDPSSNEGLGTKLGFDATIPLEAPEMRFKRIQIPGEADIDLDTVIDTSANELPRRSSA